MKYLPLLFIPASFLLAWILGILVRILDRLRLRKETVIAEYEIPHLLEPAELGYLFDSKSGNQEFLATVIHLAGKQIVTFAPHERNNPLIQINVRNEDVLLSDIEAATLAWIKRSKLSHATYEELSKGFAAALGAKAMFEREVLHSLQGKGYISRRPYFSLLGWDASQVLTILSIVLLLASLVLTLNTGNQLFDEPTTLDEVDSWTVLLGSCLLAAVFWPVVLYFYKIVFWIHHVAAGRPLQDTTLLKKRWKDIAGYALFLRTVEFSRLDADTNPHDESMPYAVALGFKPSMDKMTELAAKR